MRYNNLTVMTLLNLNHFLITTQAELCLKLVSAIFHYF